MPVSVKTVHAAPQKTAFGVASALDCVAPLPVNPDTACVNSPAPVTVPELTSPETTSSNLESLRTVDFLKPACHKSSFL